ncbi:MAG: glutamate--tRNA ligase [Candidatus Azambacteria bacterium]|nr:glutamate--tRNA ligase [Candidatus Azambacteria bacterium]
MSFLKNLFSFDGKEKIRTRFAPSPTGLFHIGNVRTALFNFLFSKKYGGKFILRIEDTDLNRYDSAFEKDIIETLKWLNIFWDEGPYKQSERLDIYAKYIRKLLDSGYAFYCFHSKEFLKQEREEQIKNKKIPGHNCDFKKVPLKDSEKHLSKEGALIRFRTPVDFGISFTDLIRGEIQFNSDAVGGDFSLAKAEGPDKFLPLYNLAVVIDDFEMNITHIIRGEDHISNTPKQILIQKALQIPMPKYAHLPLILGADKSKLSKRHMAVSVSEYREEGYLPEALLNFIALLGWNPGTDKEIFDLEELIKEFSIEKVQKSGAIFDLEKLNWLNGIYLRQLSLDQLSQRAVPFLKKEGLIGKEYDLDYIKKVLSIEQPRLKKLSEVGERLALFFKTPEYRPELLIWRDMLFKDVMFSLKVSLAALNKVDEADFIRASLEKILLQEAGRAKNKDKGRLLWPLRAALTGLEASPGPFEILEILGKEESIKRISAAIKKLV